MIKDRILSFKYSNYYKTNYFQISFECDAEIQEYIFLMNYIYELGFEFTSDIEESIKNFIDNEILRNSTKLRKFDDLKEFLPLSELFDEKVSLSELDLQDYPALRIEYTEDENGNIRRKTKDELRSSYQSYANDEGVFEYLKELLEKSENE